MSKQFDSFVEACAKAVTPEKSALPAEFIAAAKTVGEKVEAWGLDHGLMTQKSLPRGGKFFAAIENFECDKIEQALGPQAVADLIAECGIPKCHEVAAAKKIGTILCQVLGKEGAIAFADYNSNDTEMKGDLISLESLYGSDLWSQVAPATEAFGINMDRVTPDLKTILTVALLQFHVSLTPRIVPIQSVTQSNVQITREMMDVFDMSKPDDPPTRVIDLYRDPSMVSVKAIRIEPRKANDTAKVAYDGVYKFQEELNLFKLALDASKDGYDKYNHTDIIEDNIMVDGVVVKITKAGSAAVGNVGDPDYVAATDPVTEMFLITLPRDKARLTQVPNDYRSTERRLTLDRTTLKLNAASVVKVAAKSASSLSYDDLLNDSSNASAILSGLTENSGKFLAIKLNLTAHVDRKTGNASASAWGKLTYGMVDGSYSLTDTDKDELSKLTLEFVGVKIDARYNEDNKRKTSIRAEINRRNMSYELPAGRNFVIDFAIGQEGAVNAAARLAQLEHIGRDGNNLKIVQATLDSVYDQRAAFGNTAAANTEIATTYAAGDMVHQTVYFDNLDFSSGFLAARSCDAEGDIKQFVKLRLNKIVTGLLATSLLQEQLADGQQVTFRMITSPYLLGTILSCHHIHQHLDGLDQRGSGDVQYVLNLDCGAKLEVVTTTFSVMTNRIMIVPFFESAPTSILNFGTDFDQGTLVGAITLGADNSAAHNRMFSTTRECLIPTNVVGAVIEVVGLGSTNVAMAYPGMTSSTAWSTLTT